MHTEHMLLGPLKLFIGSLLLGGWTYLTCCVPLGSATFAEHIQRVTATPEAQALGDELGMAIRVRVLHPAREALREKVLAWARRQEDLQAGSATWEPIANRPLGPLAESSPRSR